MKSPVHISEVPSEVWYEGTDREIRGKALCDVGGPATVGVGYVELPPGSHTKPGHWHSKEEEHLYALSESKPRLTSASPASLFARAATSAFRPGNPLPTTSTTPAARASPTS